MSLAATQTAIEARCLIIPGEVPIWGAYDPPPGQPWLQASMPGRDRQPMGPMKDTPYLRTGILQLVVKQPYAHGLIPAQVRVDKILAHFPRGLTLTQGATKVIVDHSSDAPEVNTADWRSIPVLIRWQCTE